MQIRRISIGELREIEAEEDKAGLFPILSNFGHWTDYQFQTGDGRTYGLFLDGESIEHRLDAQFVGLTKHLRKQLRQIAGFILELGDDRAEPLIFADKEALAGAWLALHNSHGVRLNEDERCWYENVVEWELEEDD